MSKEFDDLVKTMDAKLKRMLSNPPYQPIQLISTQLPSLDISGVYIFSQMNQGVEEFLYVGQSLKISKRLQQHCAIRGPKYANFAYQLTIKRSGIHPLKGTPSSTKKSMFNDPRFVAAFNGAIQDIKQMNFRYIQMNGKLEKNLFEVYVAVTKKTEFNHFG